MRYENIDESFTFERIITSTSKSNIWLATEVGTKSSVVVKELFLKKICDPQHVWNERAVLERLSALDFPRAPRLLGTSKNTESLFIIMSLIEGAPLHMHMLPGGFETDIVKHYFAQTLSILEFLHDHDILYRDLKLSNLVLCDGRIFLVDFGTAKIMPNELTRTNSVCGTTHAMAPEVLAGSEYGFECDFFSLGILLYEMITGKPPVTFPVSSDNPKLTRDAIDLISSLLKADPRERLCSFSALRASAYFAGHSSVWWNSVSWASSSEEDLPDFNPWIGTRFIHGNQTKNSVDVFDNF